MIEETDNKALKKSHTDLFTDYIDALSTRSVCIQSQEGVKYRCPCCGYRTLDDRGGFDICEVCFWEDDGQDDVDAATNRPLGPNHISLAQARENYQRIGASHESLLKYVRPPLPEEE